MNTCLAYSEVHGLVEVEPCDSIPEALDHLRWSTRDGGRIIGIEILGLVERALLGPGELRTLLEASQLAEDERDAAARKQAQVKFTHAAWISIPGAGLWARVQSGSDPAELRDDSAAMLGLDTDQDIWVGKVDQRPPGSK